MLCDGVIENEAISLVNKTSQTSKEWFSQTEKQALFSVWKHKNFQREIPFFHFRPYSRSYRNKIWGVHTKTEVNSVFPAHFAHPIVLALLWKQGRAKIKYSPMGKSNQAVFLPVLTRMTLFGRAI
jgi:hypothetical protein